MPAICRVIKKGGVPVGKVCCACGALRPLDEFRSNLYTNGERHYVGRCRGCLREYAAAKYRDNLLKSRERSRIAKKRRALHLRHGTCSEYVLRCAIWKALKLAMIREFQEREALENERRLREWSFYAKVRKSDREKKVEVAKERDWAPFGSRHEIEWMGSVDHKTPYHHLVEKEDSHEARWLDIYISKLPSDLSRAARDLMEGLPVTLSERRALQAEAFKLLNSPRS